MSAAPSTCDHIEDFRRAMYDAGVPYVGPIEGDGKLRRFYVEGDRKGRLNGWYTYFDDARPAGAFGTWKGSRHTWSAERNTVKPLSREEREEQRRREAERRAARAAEEAAKLARAAERSQAMWDKATDAAEHAYLTRKGVGAYGLRVGEFWKERKDGAAYLAAKGALLIPMRNAAKQIVSLQAIYAQPIKVGEETRDKDFVYGGQKIGVWTTIGAPTEVAGHVTVGICEGYATGASVHEAAGLGVVVAFDAGNLMAVAKEVRRLMPRARIVLLADNDLFTVIQEKPVNVGLIKATAAAHEIGGEVIAPEFADISAKPTDWNDLHALAGAAEVRRQIMAVLDPQLEPEPEEEAFIVPEPPPIENIEDLGPMPDREPAAAEPLEDDEDDRVNPYFRVLGYANKRVFIHQIESGVIEAYAVGELSESGLIAISDINWLEREFPGGNGLNKKLAANWLMRTARRRGIFDPSIARGRGAWIDGDRVVYHMGHQLWVNGQLMDPVRIKSGFIYPCGIRIPPPAAEALSVADGKRVLETLKLFAWTNPASAILLAGWIVLAPIGGALKWRPHMWITGGAGSGKSSLQALIEWLLGGRGAVHFADGNSTEAGIRQTLKADAIPVLFDEAEQNSEHDTRRVQGILSLMRQSSTENSATVLKGTASGEAMGFIMRSMFCLSSIQVGIKQQADQERVTKLNLKPKRELTDESKARFGVGLAELRADEDLPARLLRRTLGSLPEILQNVGVFVRAATEHFGTPREGDQFGTLLAGAWSLMRDRVATLDDARAMIAGLDWSGYLEDSEVDESEKALAALMGRLLRVGTKDFGVGELVQRVADPAQGNRDVDVKEADDALRRRGMIVRPREDVLLVANSHVGLDELMRGTQYGSDLKGQLGRLEGAEPHSVPLKFMGVSYSLPGEPALHVRAVRYRAPADLIGERGELWALPRRSSAECRAPSQQPTPSAD